MGYKSFRLNIILRIFSVLVTITLFNIVVFFTDAPLLGIPVLGIIALQVFSLIKYMETTNRDLTLFLDSIRYSDVSQNYRRRGMGKSFDELYSAFTEVNEEFRKARMKTEENYRYLQTVFQHVPIGLISYYSDGKIDIMNPAARKIFSNQRIRKIEELNKICPLLYETLINLSSNEKQLITAEISEESLTLMVYVTKIKLRDREFTIASLQNLKSELDAKELESWQKLIRILTHEIMNSVTPISSLTSTIDDMIKLHLINNGKIKGVSEELIEDLESALESIKKRSDGLINFVSSYRNLALIPAPRKNTFSVEKLIKRITQLMKTDLENKEIALTAAVEPENLTLFADQEQVEQVMINLVLNSINAIGEDSAGKIKLRSYLDNYGKVIIEISDTGPGIPEDARDKIFLPFFSTREGGSGIGLSLSKQIITMHGATIGFSTSSEDGTTFRIKF